MRTSSSFRKNTSVNLGPVAQWLEPAAHNGLVAGSSPAGSTKLNKLEMIIGTYVLYGGHCAIISHNPMS